MGLVTAIMASTAASSDGTTVVRSTSSVVHGAFALTLGLGMAFMQRAVREQLAELCRALPGGGVKQPLAEGSALGLSGALLLVLGLTQLHTGMTSPTAGEAFVVAEAALALLLAGLGVARGEPFFLWVSAVPCVFVAAGLFELVARAGAAARKTAAGDKAD